MDAAVSELKPMMAVFQGKTLSRRPVWFMRQAGRYLSEYRELRKTAGSFLDLCYAPELAAEVTLQPIRRFGFDAAIIFADILLVPHALGQKLDFQEGEGPVLEAVSCDRDVAGLSAKGLHDHLKPVYEALGIVADALPKDVTLVGFCGAPWTVATYMIAGRGTPDQRPARQAAYRSEAWFCALMELITEASIEYLCAQVAAGAEIVQIFDTWAGVLDDAGYDRWCIEPTRTIVEGVRARCPDVPVIGFPRGSGVRYQRYVEATGVDGVGLDWMVPLSWARDNLPDDVVLQGNLDPIVLASGGKALDGAVENILNTVGSRRHVFNLGHGILPDTPVEHVEQVLRLVRGH